jgi:hypothetical protein
MDAVKEYNRLIGEILLSLSRGLFSAILFNRFLFLFPKEQKKKNPVSCERQADTVDHRNVRAIMMIALAFLLLLLLLLLCVCVCSLQPVRNKWEIKD